MPTFSAIFRNFATPYDTGISYSDIRVVHLTEKYNWSQLVEV